MGVGVGVVEKIKSGRRKRKSALILKREIGERDKEAPRAKNKKVNLDLEKFQSIKIVITTKKNHHLNLKIPQTPLLYTAPPYLG